jgi:hypothetical protein
MPFDTPAGKAILIENIVNVPELAERLGVHVNTVHNWIRNKNTTWFPDPLPCGDYHFDYDEVYEWFHNWVMDHPKFYPIAYAAMKGGSQ